MYAKHVFFAFLLFSGWQAHAQLEQTIPPGGSALLDANALETAGFWPGSGTVTRKTVAVDGPGFSSAVEVNIIESAPNNWDGQLQINLNTSVELGDVALLHFWMRVTAIENESGIGSLLAMVQQSGSPYTNSAEATVLAESDWVPLYIPFSFASDYQVGAVQVKIGLGQGNPRTVQLGGLQLLNYQNRLSLDTLPATEFTYDGREPEASWREDAATRIEAHRKGNFTLRFETPSGEPLDVQLDAALARHQFHFASVVSVRALVGSSEDSQTYREKVVELFNASGTENALKWPPLEGEWGADYNYTATSDALEWLRLRGFFLRGHVLVWPGESNLPTFVQDLLAGTREERATVPDEVRDHIAETVPTYAQWIDEWDVLNEPYSNFTLMETFEPTNPDLMAEWFMAARAAAGPNVGLYLNEYNLLSGRAQNIDKRTATIATLRKILDDGGPITGMGMQGHFNDSSLTSITRVKEVLDQFATEFPNLRIRVTEYDLVSENQTLQADYLRDVLTLVFSHPQVDGFQMWGFWAGAHWRPSAALYELDWTPRLQVQAYRDLLASWDTQFNLATDGAGTIGGRGFKGDYTGALTTNQGNYDLLFPISASEQDFTLTLPPSDEINTAKALAMPGANHLVIAFPTAVGIDYWVELSEDGASWQAETLPQSGNGRPQVRVIAVPPSTTLWRVVSHAN